MASCETHLASIETVGSWSEVRSIARISKADFLLYSYWSFSYRDPPIFSCMERWATPREEFFKIFLVKVDDQVSDGNGFRILTVALRRHLLIAEEDLIPQRNRHLIFH